MDTLLWYMEITWDYVKQMLPCAALGALGFFSLRPYRKRRLAGNGLKSGPGREGMILLFVLFSAGLSALTLFPQRFWRWPILPLYSWEHNAPGSFYWSITIFLELAEAGTGGSWRLFMLLGNHIMFTPFGFFPSFVGDKPGWWKALLTGLCVSSFIEIVQLFVGRSSDINDIILNTAGTLCGFWVYLLLKRLAPRFTARFKLQKTEVPDGRETGN